MSNIKIVSDNDEFDALLKAAGDDLVVIDFFTTWCEPCRNMEPVYESMAIRYPKVMFLKVDADKCFDTAMTYRVSGVPYFVIYFNKTVVETVQGANAQELELKIRLAEIESRRANVMEHSNLVPSNPLVISTYGKFGSVSAYVDFEQSRCINDLSPTSFHNFLGGKKLISGKGSGKIVLLYVFTQKIMLQSFKIKANPQTGPKVLRFFVNHPKVLDFNVGSTLAPSQEATLSHHDLTGERAIELRSGSFQMVTNVQIFVTCGQAKNSRIEIESLQLFGAPVLGTQRLKTTDSLAPHHVVESAKTCSVIPSSLEQQDSTSLSNNCNNCNNVTPSSVDHKPTHQHPTEELPGHSRNLITAHHNLTQQEQHHPHHSKNRHHHSLQ